MKEDFHDFFIGTTFVRWLNPSSQSLTTLLWTYPPLSYTIFDCVYLSRVAWNDWEPALNCSPQGKVSSIQVISFTRKFRPDFWFISEISLNRKFPLDSKHSIIFITLTSFCLSSWQIQHCFFGFPFDIIFLFPIDKVTTWQWVTKSIFVLFQICGSTLSDQLQSVVQRGWSPADSDGQVFDTRGIVFHPLQRDQILRGHNRLQSGWVGTLFHVPPGLLGSHVSYVFLDEDMPSLIPTKLRTNPDYSIYFNWFRFIAIGIVPFGLLVFFNAQIYRALHQRRKRAGFWRNQSLAASCKFRIEIPNSTWVHSLGEFDELPPRHWDSIKLLLSRKIQCGESRIRWDFNLNLCGHTVFFKLAMKQSIRANSSNPSLESFGTPKLTWFLKLYCSLLFCMNLINGPQVWFVFPSVFFAGVNNQIRIGLILFLNKHLSKALSKWLFPNSFSRYRSTWVFFFSIVVALCSIDDPSKEISHAQQASYLSWSGFWESNRLQVILNKCSIGTSAGFHWGKAQICKLSALTPQLWCSLKTKRSKDGDRWDPRTRCSRSPSQKPICDSFQATILWPPFRMREMEVTKVKPMSRKIQVG